MNKIIIYIFVFFTIIYSQKNNKSKDKIEFNNNESNVEYKAIFNKSFDLLKTNYVDSINESEIIKSGIRGLTKPLDPYTKLLEGNSKDSYDILRRGKYGGVGIQIGIRKDTLTVLAPMEDSPAYSEGIYSGDKILKIDSTFTERLTLKEASNLIKGELGSAVILGIFRPSTKERIDFELFRDNITVKHVPYSGVNEEGVGYIRITRFSKNCAKDFKKALNEMKLDSINEMKSLIIDLRGNSGGLLSNAIRILDYLIDRGEILLTSKGKTNKSNKEWKSRVKPLVSIDIPIIVLINKSSASASEIVAGTLQDLDRAVIIGQKSFGKGLVQHMYDLNDTTTLKITTAKYYLPSGRLIQKEDYLNNGFLTDGLDKQDTVFYSKSGRELKGGGGITPDIQTEILKFPSYINALWKSGAFLSFAANYAPHHKEIKDPIFITNKIMDDFKSFLDDYDLNYKIAGEKEFEKLNKIINKSPISINKYSKNVSYINNKNNILNDMNIFFKQLRKIQYSLEDNQKLIKNGLLREFSRVIVNDKERIKVSLIEDVDYKRSKLLLLNMEEYYKIINLE